MANKKVLFILGLIASASLASGAVFASVHTITDNAQPGGARISLGKAQGYYLLGDSVFTGSAETAWKIEGGVYLSNGIVEREIAVGAQFKVAYYAGGTIADDAWYNTLATSYPFAFIEDKTNNVQIKYARTYQITFDETNKEISIVDKNGSIYTPGYYLADVSVANDFSKPLNDAEPGDNTAQKDEGYALAKDHVYKVMHTDGYAASAVAAYGAVLGGPHDFASNVAEEGGIQINYASTYGIYYKKSGESAGLWLADKNPAPYAAYKNNYFIKIGENNPVVSGTPGDNNLGKWSNVTFADNDTFTFLHSETGYALEAGYKDGDGNALPNDIYTVTTGGKYNVYLNAEKKVYLEAVPAEGYYITIGSSDPVRMESGVGGDLAMLRNQKIGASDNVTIQYDDGNGNKTAVPLERAIGTAAKDAENYSFGTKGLYSFFVNSEGKLYITWNVLFYGGGYWDQDSAFISLYVKNADESWGWAGYGVSYADAYAVFECNSIVTQATAMRYDPNTENKQQWDTYWNKCENIYLSGGKNIITCNGWSSTTQTILD